MPPAPLSVLIVEDDSIITHLLSTMLQKKGYAVAGVVPTGEEAVQKAGDLHPDLVIMDVTLAGAMDGIDAAHYIFQLFQCPVLFITGITDEARIEKVKFSRPYGIIFKPFTAIQITTGVDLAIFNHANRTGGSFPYPAGDPKKLPDALEAILIMDRRGKILYLNASASWYVDLPAEKILSKHWREVMMFINDKSGEQLKDPVAEASGHMAATIYDTNTGLVTTSSKQRKVIVSTRPLMDDHNRFLAVLMSIREKAPKPGAGGT